MKTVAINGHICCSKEDEIYMEELCLQPYTHVIQNPDEIFSINSIKIFSNWLKVPEKKCAEIESIFKMGYYGTLLVDDIQDSTILRGCIPVAHSIYGVPRTLNAASYAFLVSVKQILDFHPDATAVVIPEILDIIRGSELEIKWRDRFTCPTEEEYCDMAYKKTAGMVQIFIKLGQLFSTNKTDVSNFAKILGLFLQIRNDYTNLKDQKYMESKGYCEDITEGKFSFPIVHAIQNHPDGQEIMSILRQRTNDIKLKKHCVDLLEKCGSFEYTRNFAKKLKDEAVKEVQRLDGTQEVFEFLEYLGKFIF